VEDSAGSRHSKPKGVSQFQCAGLIKMGPTYLLLLLEISWRGTDNRGSLRTYNNNKFKSRGSRNQGRQVELQAQQQQLDQQQ